MSILLSCTVSFIIQAGRVIMESSEKNKLMKEYAKRLFVVFRILEIPGFCRFIIRNEKIVERSLSGILYNIFVIILADVGAMALLWNGKQGSLSRIEFIAILYSVFFGNVLYFHITFGDKYRGRDLIQNCIDLDVILGSKETYFLRKLMTNFYKLLVFLVGLTQIVVVVYMYYVFKVSIAIHIIGSAYFFWIFFAYDDFCLYLFTWLFLGTRARYINVALLKISNMDMEYLPKQLLFHKLFWSDKYDEVVTFHTRADVKSFLVALKLLFHQVRHVERVYKFPILFSVFTVMLGSFVTVQTFIMYIEASQEILRASVITGWLISTWFYILVMSTASDVFYRQIEQTKLICAFIQLTPSSSYEMLKLTKDIIATLEIRDPKVSLYDVFYFDTGFVFKLAVSTCMYMTVQLQLAFSNVEEGHRTDNITAPATFELDRNAIKEFLFIY